MLHKCYYDDDKYGGFFYYAPYEVEEELNKYKAEVKALKRKVARLSNKLQQTQLMMG